MLCGQNRQKFERILARVSNLVYTSNARSGLNILILLWATPPWSQTLRIRDSAVADSLRIAGHWPFGWGHFLTDETTAVPMIDRALYHAVIVVVEAESLRMREARTRGGNPSKREMPRSLHRVATFS